MKLYHRVSRFEFLRSITKKDRDNILWALSLKPGDLINDCTGFNVVIRKIEPDIMYVNNGRGGWYICDIDFTTEPLGGSCSLMHCGIQSPRTPKEITNYIKRWYDEWGEPHGGWHWKTDNDPVWQKLKNCLPICDEKGMKI
jgi:hypothetical protein